MSALLRYKVGADLLRSTGVSEADYGVLVHLSEADEGRLRPNEIGCAIQWEKSRHSHHLDRMERRGLVRRLPCKTDNRGALIAITPAGRRAIEDAAPKHVAYVRRAFVQALTPAQLDALAEISEVLTAHLANMP